VIQLLPSIMSDIIGQTFIDANWGLFWVTIVLVGVTFFYAIQTWKLVRVPFLPVLRPRFVQDVARNNDILLKLQIMNIGPGVATDIAVKYSVKNTKNTSQSEKIELLEPKKTSKHLNLDHLPPITTQGYYSQQKVIVSIKLNYKDIFRKRHHYKTELDASAEAAEI
jgi:hypothetical protein